MAATPKFAFVTLVTSDHYLPGALVVVAALRDIHTSPPTSPEELDPSDFHTVCLVTPESVDVSTVKLLRKAFDVVVGVELIEEDNEEGLKLLGRLDLRTVLTKLHIFRLADYRKIIYLDADVLPLRPLSHLFRLSSDFAAVPDVGWPDIFNSGFLVLNPGTEKFDQVMSLVKSKGSWDGGDQGVLNEWKGNDWERLSFIYNTTPTAAYTYAPAYKRFGPQICNIHFIGPNKPWTQITFRAPGSTSSGSEFVQTSQHFAPPPSYAYPALLDRWFAVYDKHYRSSSADLSTDGVPSESTAAGSGHPIGVYANQRYENAWNSEEASFKTEADFSAYNTPLGLEELRRVAVEGLGSTGSTEGEGVYRSLPLEGRIDLMHPKKPARRVSDKPALPMVQIQVTEDPHTPPRSHSPPPMTTLPTPGPNEFPPTPVFRGHSLPPETPRNAQYEQMHPPPISPLSATSPLHSKPNYPRQSPSPHLHARPLSPPLISWNPAIEAPPSVPPPASHFPEQTYFPNVWDAQTRDFHTPESGDGFFPLPPPSNIPEQLIREGHYKSVIGDTLEVPQRLPSPPHQQQQEEVDSGHQQQHHDQHQEHFDMPSHPRPDRSKISTVFPWEEKPRHAPERFYPPTDSPPPGQPFLQPASPALKIDLPRVSLQATSHPPVHGFPRTTTYANAWDAVPSIQRYASKLVRPAPAVAPLVQEVPRRTRKGSAATAGGDGYRSWQDRVEISSRDADDEDEEDDEGEYDDDDERNPPSIGTESDHSERRGVRLPKKTYKVKGVQTIPREVRHQGVQVPNGKRAARSGPVNDFSQHGHDTGKDEGNRQTVPRKLGRLPQDMKVFEQMAGGSPAVNAPGFMLPRPAPTASQDRIVTLPELSPDQPVLSAEAASPQTYITSPPSSLQPLSPPDGAPLTAASQTVFRPAARTFDPARGVDVFKRGSEEVLARFLRMGSWEEESPRGQSSPSAV